MARLRVSWRTSLTAPQQARNPQSESIARNPYDEAVELHGPKYGSGVGVDLVDLAVAILSDPEGAFRPREPRGTAGGRRDRGEHVPGLRIDFLDAILGDLKQVAAVVGRPRVRGDVNGAQLCSSCRIQGSQGVPGRKPDLLPVVGNAVHGLDPRKGTILTSDFGDRYFHEVNLGAR